MAAIQIREKLMGEDLQHIDALFKQGLEDVRLSPPDGVFEECVGQLNQSMSTGSGASSLATSWGAVIKSPLAWFGVVAVTAAVGYFVMDHDFSDGNQNSGAVTTTAEAFTDNEKVRLAEPSSNSVKNGDKQVAHDRTTLELKQKANKVADATTDEGALVSKSVEAHSDGVNTQKQEVMAGGQKSNKVQSSGLYFKPCKEVLGGWRPMITENVGGLVSLELNGRYGNIYIYWGDGEKSLVSGLTDNTVNRVSHSYLVAQKKNFVVKLVNVVTESKSGITCADSQRLSMLVQPANEVTTVFVPDVFTPNGDGTNDVFFVEMPKPLQFDMTILDVNNRTVFRSNDYKDGWSGTYMNTDCKEDVYRVIVSYKYSGEKDWKYIRKQIKLIR